MRRMLSIAIFSFLLFNSSLVFAVETQGEAEHSHTTKTSGNEERINLGHEHGGGSIESLTSGNSQVEESNKIENTSSEHSEHGEEEATHNTDESEHGTEGGHGSEEETESAPNYRVLAVFGVINLTFILIGIWNKVIRKRGNNNGFAK